LKVLTKPFSPHESMRIMEKQADEICSRIRSRPVSQRPSLQPSPTLLLQALVAEAKQKAEHDGMNAETTDV